MKIEETITSLGGEITINPEEDTPVTRTSNLTRLREHP
jgi:hypothetical protein